VVVSLSSEQAASPRTRLADASVVAIRRAVSIMVRSPYVEFGGSLRAVCGDDLLDVVDQGKRPVVGVDHVDVLV
jgi:hypothetical protein